MIAELHTKQPLYAPYVASALQVAIPSFRAFRGVDYRLLFKPWAPPRGPPPPTSGGGFCLDLLPLTGQ